MLFLFHLNHKQVNLYHEALKIMNVKYYVNVSRKAEAETLE